MRRVWLMGLALVFLFGSAAGVDKKGKIGIGFFNDEAPLGGRYWITERFGFDLGIGFNLRNVVDSTQDTNLQSTNLRPSKKSLTEFRLDAGLPLNLLRTEKVNFLLRPGITYAGTPFFNSFTRDSIRIDSVVVDVDTTGGVITVIKDGIRTPVGTVLDSVREDRSKSFDVNLSLGIEYFPADNFSVSLFTGIGARSEKRFKKSQSTWTVTHRPFFRGTNIGFHFYF